MQTDIASKALKMIRPHQSRTLEILLIEDNLGDIRLLEEVFRELQANINLHVAHDGAEALTLMSERRSKASPPPDIILLDLNLPKISGHEVLLRIKSDPDTCHIPVIILTSSRAESDIRLAYDSHANAYLRKPSTLDGLMSAAQQIKKFWLETATLPL